MKRRFKPCGPQMKRNPHTNRCKKVSQRKRGGREKSLPSIIPTVTIKTEEVPIVTRKENRIAKRKIEKSRSLKSKLKNKLPVVPMVSMVPMAPVPVIPVVIKKEKVPISFAHSLKSLKNKESETGGWCTVTKKEASEFSLLFGLSIYNDQKNKGKADWCKILTEFFPSTCLPDGWKVTRVLGKGLSGYVFGVISPTGEKGALKVTQDETYNSIISEMEMGKRFYEIGLAPETKAYCRFTPPGSNKKLHLLLMGRIDSTVGQYLSKLRTKKEIDNLVDKIFKAIAIIAENGLTHGDLHGDNISFIHSDDGIGKLALIDFGLSSNKISIPELDSIQALRQNFYMSSKERPRENRKLFSAAIKREAKRIYGFKFTSIDSIESRFEELRDQLEETLK